LAQWQIEDEAQRQRSFDCMIGELLLATTLPVGIESRSSSAIRMPRDPETRLARGFANLYPVGYGAGCACGIMSAAIDGARTVGRALPQPPPPGHPQSWRSRRFAASGSLLDAGP
jgi:uncharacterized FAD-dependent dehydrogenase